MRLTGMRISASWSNSEWYLNVGRVGWRESPGRLEEAKERRTWRVRQCLLLLVRIRAVSGDGIGDALAVGLTTLLVDTRGGVVLFADFQGAGQSEHEAVVGSQLTATGVTDSKPVTAVQFVGGCGNFSAINIAVAAVRFNAGQ